MVWLAISDLNWSVIVLALFDTRPGRTGTYDTVHFATRTWWLASSVLSMLAHHMTWVLYLWCDVMCPYHIGSSPGWWVHWFNEDTHALEQKLHSLELLVICCHFHGIGGSWECHCGNDIQWVPQRITQRLWLVIDQIRRVIKEGNIGTNS